MAYAEKTTVAFERSIGEIISLLRRAGAASIMQAEEARGYMVQFMLSDRLVRFTVPFPTLDEMPTRNGNNAILSAAVRKSKLDQAIRQRGRALLLVIKAKLESTESGVETFEQAFLAHVVMSDGQTVYDRISGPISQEYLTGKVANILPALPAPGQP